MLFVVLKSYILEVRFMIWSGKKKIAIILTFLLIYSVTLGKIFNLIELYTHHLNKR